VAALEAKINVRFPDDFRQFLLEYNGGYFNEPQITPTTEGCPRDALTFLSGIGASHWEADLGDSRAFDLFDDNDPPKILSIGDTALGGLIILDVAPGDGRGELYYKQAFGDFFYLADNIEHFFSLLRPSVKS